MEFPDYKRGPGFWFLFELLIAVDVCAHPTLSARVSDFKAQNEEEDMYEIFNEGLTVYEKVSSFKHKGW